MEFLLQGVVGAAGAFGLLAATFGTSQRSLIFTRPSGVKRAKLGCAAGSYELSKSSFESTDGIKLEVSESKFSGRCKGTIIYFGGRRENTEWATDISSYAEGWNVVASNYRGFGSSEGTASEKCVKDDALQLFDEVRGRDGPVVVVGRSLGSCVALHVAAMRRCEGLILVSPMDSLKSVIQAKILTRPFAWMLKDKFECVDLAKRVDQRTLVVLAVNDRQVPMAASARLYESITGNVSLQLIGQVNHCNVHRAKETLDCMASFLSGVPAREPKLAD